MVANSSGSFAVSDGVSSATKRLARGCIRLIPRSLQRIVLRSAALASPAMKTEAFERACCKIARTSFPHSKEIWATNLGVSSDLRCQMPLVKDYYVFGRPENMLSERATVALVTELCRDCTDFLDVGANDGIFTFAVDREATPDLRLHWFEPDRTLHDRLKSNLAANAIHAVGNFSAVAARRGTAKFFKNPIDDTSGSLIECHAPQQEPISEQVETISLACYFDDHRVRNAIVKVDVEGAADEVWRGARGIEADIRYLIMEMIAPEIQCGLPGKVISEGNFHAYYIKDFDLILSRDGSYRYVAPFLNWLFCRLDPESLRTRLAGTRFSVVEDAI